MRHKGLQAARTANCSPASLHGTCQAGPRVLAAPHSLPAASATAPALGACSRCNRAAQHPRSARTRLVTARGREEQLVRPAAKEMATQPSPPPPLQPAAPAACRPPARAAALSDAMPPPPAAFAAAGPMQVATPPPRRGRSGSSPRLHACVLVLTLLALSHGAAAQSELGLGRVGLCGRASWGSTSRALLGTRGRLAPRTAWLACWLTACVASRAHPAALPSVPQTFLTC